MYQLNYIFNFLPDTSLEVDDESILPTRNIVTTKITHHCKFKTFSVRSESNKHFSVKDFIFYAVFFLLLLYHTL